jgi:menaquinone-dependent protoporphyrinogen oxidase
MRTGSALAPPHAGTSLAPFFDDMARILVIYATKEGQSEKIARRVATAIEDHGHEAELIDIEHARPPEDVERYRAVVVCAPIHARGYPRSILRFARDHREQLERVPSAFLSIGLAVASRTHDGRAQTLPIVEDFVKKSGWRPQRVELVAGALPYSKYNFLVRYVMRRISEKEGGDTDTSRDYEYTDWKALDRFAAEWSETIEPRATRSP